MSKTALISERIKALEGKLDKSANILGKEAGIGNGTVGGWTDNQVEKPTAAVEKFLRHYNIREEWWKTGKGEIFNTSVHNEAAVTEKPLRAPEEIYRDLVEANSEYRLVPKVILEGKYVIVLENQIGKTEEALWETIRAKNELIADLKEEIALYRASRTLTKERK